VYNYRAYNLGLNSALLLPELQTSAEVEADVLIRLGHIDWSPPATSPTGDLCFAISPGEAHFFWAQLGKFRVRGGNEIIVDPCAGVEERLLRLPLLGTVLAVLLHQRRWLVLHASAVAISGEALIFIGNKEHGKSTLAATLYGRGHHLIADDVVAVSVDDLGRPIVMPGFPQFKLYPEALLSSLGDDHTLLPQLAEGYEKRGRRVTDRFTQQPLPLKGVYALARGPVLRLKPLASRTALLSLIANSYMARFGSQLLQGEEAAAHLHQCARVVSKVAICRLERPCALPLLPAVAQMIEEHMKSSDIPSVARPAPRLYDHETNVC
jgi:hypothetical protein